jgi:hypothetical protein
MRYLIALTAVAAFMLLAAPVFADDVEVTVVIPAAQYLNVFTDSITFDEVDYMDEDGLHFVGQTIYYEFYCNADATVYTEFTEGTNWDSGITLTYDDAVGYGPGSYPDEELPVGCDATWDVAPGNYDGTLTLTCEIDQPD